MSHFPGLNNPAPDNPTATAGKDTHPGESTQPGTLTAQQYAGIADRETEPYRDDVREALERAGWRENAEGHVVAGNGALWAETNTALDSGIDAPDKSWTVTFDRGVPGPVIVAAALAASGVDVPALLADNTALRDALARARATADTAWRKIEAVEAYLAGLDTAKLSHDAVALGFHIVAMLDGPGPRATDNAALRDVLAQVAKTLQSRGEGPTDGALLARIAGIVSRATEDGGL